MKIALTVGHSILKNGNVTSADGRAYGGVLEYEYCKSQAAPVAEYLRSAGHTVDVIICPERQFAASKEERTYKLNKVNNGGYNLVVELHLNASVNHNAEGCEVYYYSATGKPYAERICSKLGTIFKNRGAKQQTNLYMLSQTKPVAILIESFFCDYAKDCQKAANAGVEKIGRLIAEGIANKTIENTTTTPGTSGTLYKVQVGAYREKGNADAMLSKLKKAGFAGFVVRG